MTNRGAAEDDLSRARDRVREGCSIRAAAKDFKIARMTLKKYVDKCNQQNDGQNKFQGLTRNKCCELIVEYVLKNNVTVPDSWQQNEMTGEQFWMSFNERNHLAIQTPEATSLARASAFNRYNVCKFYNLKRIMDPHQFEIHDIYNADETECI
uniref:Resolvase HTH domain-containing protein n=1 Tax=Octopus bimaculoides TaxID=37653 RepID=A0A0L8GXD2_OCTBM